MIPLTEKQALALQSVCPGVQNSLLGLRLKDAVERIIVEEAEPKILVFKVVADASGSLAIPGLSEGDEVIGVHVICTVTQGSGTLIVETGGDDDITDGIACATDKAVDYAAEIDDAFSTLPATGAKVISVGGTAANTRGIVIITYIPA